MIPQIINFLRRMILPFLVGGVLGVAAGFAGGIFVYPYWFLTDIAMEDLPQPETKVAVAKGEFIHVNKSDPVHWGKGHTTIYTDRSGDRLVHLENDFEVGPGPRFHVYLVNHGAVRSKSDFLNSESVDLGRLRAFKGSQVYAIPGSVELGKYKSVVVWCKEFGVLITPASLTAAAKSKEPAPTSERERAPRVRG